MVDSVEMVVEVPAEVLARALAELLRGVTNGKVFHSQQECEEPMVASVFYVLWAILVPMALWSIIYPRHYFKTFYNLLVPGLWFVKKDRVDLDGPMYVRILGVLLMLVVVAQAAMIFLGSPAQPK